MREARFPCGRFGNRLHTELKSQNKEESNMPIGIVPWTLRHQLFTAEQVENTYKKLQELGFDGVESGLGNERDFEEMWYF